MQPIHGCETVESALPMGFMHDKPCDKHIVLVTVTVQYLLPRMYMYV